MNEVKNVFPIEYSLLTKHICGEEEHKRECTIYNYMYF